MSANDADPTVVEVAQPDTGAGNVHKPLSDDKENVVNGSGDLHTSEPTSKEELVDLVTSKIDNILANTTNGTVVTEIPSADKEIAAATHDTSIVVEQPSVAEAEVTNPEPSDSTPIVSTTEVNADSNEDAELRDTEEIPLVESESTLANASKVADVVVPEKNHDVTTEVPHQPPVSEETTVNPVPEVEDKAPSTTTEVSTSTLESVAEIPSLHEKSSDLQAPVTETVVDAEPASTSEATKIEPESLISESQSITAADDKPVVEETHVAGHPDSAPLPSTEAKSVEQASPEETGPVEPAQEVSTADAEPESAAQPQEASNPDPDVAEAVPIIKSAEPSTLDTVAPTQAASDTTPAPSELMDASEPAVEVAKPVDVPLHEPEVEAETLPNTEEVKADSSEVHLPAESTTESGVAEPEPVTAAQEPDVVATTEETAAVTVETANDEPIKDSEVGHSVTDEEVATHHQVEESEDVAAAEPIASVIELSPAPTEQEPEVPTANPEATNVQAEPTPAVEAKEAAPVAVDPTPVHVEEAKDSEVAALQVEEPEDVAVAEPVPPPVEASTPAEPAPEVPVETTKEEEPAPAVAVEASTVDLESVPRSEASVKDAEVGHAVADDEVTSQQAPEVVPVVTPSEEAATAAEAIVTQPPAEEATPAIEEAAAAEEHTPEIEVVTHVEPAVAEPGASDEAPAHVQDQVAEPPIHTELEHADQHAPKSAEPESIPVVAEVATAEVVEARGPQPGAEESQIEEPVEETPKVEVAAKEATEIEQVAKEEPSVEEAVAEHLEDDEPAKDELEVEETGHKEVEVQEAAVVQPKVEEAIEEAPQVEEAKKEGSQVAEVVDEPEDKEAPLEEAKVEETSTIEEPVKELEVEEPAVADKPAEVPEIEETTAVDDEPAAHEVAVEAQVEEPSTDEPLTEEVVTVEEPAKEVLKEEVAVKEEQTQLVDLNATSEAATETVEEVSAVPVEEAKEAIPESPEAVIAEEVEAAQVPEEVSVDVLPTVEAQEVESNTPAEPSAPIELSTVPTESLSKDLADLTPPVEEVAPTHVVEEETAPAPANFEAPIEVTELTPEQVTAIANEPELEVEDTLKEEEVAAPTEPKVEESHQPQSDDVPKADSNWIPSFHVTTQGSSEALVVRDEPGFVQEPPAIAETVAEEADSKVNNEPAQVESPQLTVDTSSVGDSSEPPRPWTPSYSVHSQGSPRPSFSVPAEEAAEKKPTWTRSYSVHSQGSSPLLSPAALSAEPASLDLQGSAVETDDQPEKQNSLGPVRSYSVHSQGNSPLLAPAEQLPDPEPIALEAKEEVPQIVEPAQVEESAPAQAETELEPTPEVVVATTEPEPTPEVQVAVLEAEPTPEAAVPEPEPQQEEPKEAQASTPKLVINDGDEAIVEEADEQHEQPAQDPEVKPASPRVDRPASPSWVPSYSVEKQGAGVEPTPEPILEVESAGDKAEVPVEDVKDVETKEVEKDSSPVPSIHVQDEQSAPKELEVAEKQEEKRAGSPSTWTPSYSVTTVGSPPQTSSDKFEPLATHSPETSAATTDTAVSEGPQAPSNDTKNPDTGVKERSTPVQEKIPFVAITDNLVETFPDGTDSQAQKPSKLSVSTEAPVSPETLSPTTARTRNESIASSRFFPGGWFSPRSEGRASLENAHGEFSSAKSRVSSDDVPDSPSDMEDNQSTHSAETVQPQVVKQERGRWCVVM